MDINPTDSETTIVVFEDDGLECNGNMVSQIEYTTDKGSTKTISEESNGTFLVPETFMTQNSVLGQDFVIRCTPCNKIFVSADGYNRHVQNKECADETNTALLAEVSPENGQEVYPDEEQSHEEDNSETSKENLTSTINGALEKQLDAPICSITVESNEVINQENMQGEDGSLKSPDLSKGPTSSLSEDTSQNAPEMNTDTEKSGAINSQNITVSDLKCNPGLVNEIPKTTHEIKFLEKMSRKLYECTSCKERFCNTESLEIHSNVHLSDEVLFSNHTENQNSLPCNDDIIHNLRQKFPTVFERKLKIEIEKIDPKEHINKIALENKSTESSPTILKMINVSKSNKEIKVYCVCRKPKRRGMIGCDFCEEWFHPECLSLSTDEANALTEITWKCPVCDGKATIDYQSESNSTQPENVKKHVDVNASNESETVIKKKTIESATRLKVNVGPGEWLWLVGDQLVPPTNEEIVKERRKRPCLDEDYSELKRIKRNWANHRCKRCGEEFVSKSSMREHDCGMWKPRKEDWVRVIRESGYERASNGVSATKTVSKACGIVRQCTLCEKTYDKLSNLRNHFVNHFKDQLFARLPANEPYNCPLCKSSRNVRDKITLMRHYAYTHGVIYEYCTAEDVNGKIMKDDSSEILNSVEDVSEKMIIEDNSEIMLS